MNILQPCQQKVVLSMDSDSDDHGDIRVDDEVLKCLPEGAVITHAVPWNPSAWTRTAKVTTELPDGTTKDYFLKTCAADVAPVMMEGEFHSLSTIKSLMPDFVPQAYGWGECKGTPGTYFLIMDFLDLMAKIPDPATFATLVSDLHRKGDSPTGKFGFDKPTCHGKIVQPNTWDSNRCHYFTRLLTVFYDADMAVHGPIPGFEEAFATLKECVIPRLLEPLQANGRVLKPSLVHGDLWGGNVGTSVETGGPVVYDASCSYAHHEYELGMWRRITVCFDQTYMKQYLLRLPPSEPTEEWDDRNRLYSIKFNFSHSAHSLGASDATRRMLLDDMQYLNNKYAPNAGSMPESKLEGMSAVSTNPQNTNNA